MVRRILAQMQGGRSAGGVRWARSAFSRSTAAARPVPTFGYQVVRSYPHDREAFTQGLIYRDGVLYEGTGLNGRSGIRKVKLETGEVLQMQPLDSRSTSARASPTGRARCSADVADPRSASSTTSPRSSRSKTFAYTR